MPESLGHESIAETVLTPLTSPSICTAIYHMRKQSNSEATCFGKSWAEINTPLHGIIEPSETYIETVCGAAQPVCSERSPVSSRQPRPHMSHVRMSQAVFVPTFSYAGRDAARAHRRPDANRAAARRLELAQTLTVRREPNSNRSKGACGARSLRTRNTHQLRIDSRRRGLPTMLSRKAV